MVLWEFLDVLAILTCAPSMLESLNFDPCAFLGYSNIHKGLKCLDINTGRLYISRDSSLKCLIFLLILSSNFQKMKKKSSKLGMKACQTPLGRKPMVVRVPLQDNLMCQNLLRGNTTNQRVAKGIKWDPLRQKTCCQDSGRTRMANQSAPCHDDSRQAVPASLCSLHTRVLL
jgi:hypothetical protein